MDRKTDCLEVLNLHSLFGNKSYNIMNKNFSNNRLLICDQHIYNFTFKLSNKLPTLLSSTLVLGWLVVTSHKYFADALVLKVFIYCVQSVFNIL